MTKLKAIALTFVVGPLVSLLIVGALWLYWYLEPAEPLPASEKYKMLKVEQGESKVLDVPIYQFNYLSGLYFSTATLDIKGNIVWRTPRVPYRKNERYKILTPSKLSPGNFSVVMTIDYQLNPLYRGEDDVEFINLLVTPKPSEVTNDNSTPAKDVRSPDKR